eukprot:scaffold293745_cov33-Prasinocladus_malaysianus.AAC.1
MQNGIAMGDKQAFSGLQVHTLVTLAKGRKDGQVVDLGIRCNAYNIPMPHLMQARAQCPNEYRMLPYVRFNSTTDPSTLPSDYMVQSLRHLDLQDLRVVSPPLKSPPLRSPRRLLASPPLRSSRSLLDLRHRL